MDAELKKKLDEAETLYRKFVKSASTGEMAAGEMYDFHVVIGSLHFKCCEAITLIKTKPVI